MSQQLLTESPEKTQQHVESRETSPAFAPLFQGGFHPVAQLQRTLGNRNVAKLLQAKKLTPGGKIIGLQRKLTVGAQPFTYGTNIYFRAGSNPTNLELTAHELTHVFQQTGVAPMQKKKLGGALPANTDPLLQRTCAANFVCNGKETKSIESTQIHRPFPALQRKEIKGGGATPGKGEGMDLIFIIRAPDDQFTNDVTDYVKTVLQGQSFIEVDNLDEIFDHLSLLKARINFMDVIEPAIQVRRIRIVAHGSTTGDVKMTPKGEKNRRWVTPQEVAAYAQNALIQSTVAQVMAPGAQIEFWGCNVGAIPATGEAWSKAFNASFSATSETFKTGFDDFVRPADRGEAGETIPVHSGRWVPVTNTAEIDSRSKGLQKSFNKWLMARYTEFANNGDILPIKDQAEQLTYMRDLFNRAGGKIRHILIEKKSDQLHIRPGAETKWLKLWKTTAAPKNP